MNDTRSEYKRHAQVGPGGIRCVCCGGKTSRDRKQIKRSARRRRKQATVREVAEATDDC